MSDRKPIGGYFELELRNFGHIFHDNAKLLNSGRSAFAYILKSYAIKKITLPSYICHEILGILNKLNVEFSFYAVNENLEPEHDIEVDRDEYLLYVNYFGLRNSTAKILENKYPKTIIDNAQAFFNSPSQKRPSFYSPRKFFGVPDGGFAYADGYLKTPIEIEVPSFERCSHLIKRIEEGASEGLPDFRRNESIFESRPLAGMSKITKRILSSVDFDWVIQARNSNFLTLHNALRKTNKLTHIIDDEEIIGPLSYPYLCEKKDLRNKLNANQIFTPKYWPQLDKMTKNKNSFHTYLAEHLIPLPIDQRYNEQDMRRVVTVIKEYYG